MPGSVREIAAPESPVLVHPGWAEDFPWLVQGTTTRGSGAEPFDLGIFSEGRPVDVVCRNWARLLASVGCTSAVHARQLHGAEVRVADVSTTSQPRACPDEGPHLQEPCDGHLTRETGLLLAVATADCIPVFVVDPTQRVVGAVHAGWRGVAAGVLDRTLAALAAHFGSAPEALHVHLGPAICGQCYEVGPEVFEALDQRVPSTPTPIDLRSVLSERAVRLGVDPMRLTVSEHCTRCTGSELYSHRGGDRHRQVGFIGVRARRDRD